MQCSEQDFLLSATGVASLLKHSSKSDNERARLSAGLFSLDLKMLRSAENRASEGAGAISEGFLSNLESSQDAQIHIGHPRLSLAPIASMLQAHVGPAS